MLAGPVRIDPTELASLLKAATRLNSNFPDTPEALVSPSFEVMDDLAQICKSSGQILFRALGESWDKRDLAAGTQLDTFRTLRFASEATIAAIGSVELILQDGERGPTIAGAILNSASYFLKRGLAEALKNSNAS